MSIRETRLTVHLERVLIVAMITEPGYNSVIFIVKYDFHLFSMPSYVALAHVVILLEFGC